MTPLFRRRIARLTVHLLALGATSFLGFRSARAADDNPPAAEKILAPLQADGVRRFALVIGNNASPRAGLAQLRYADDDAVRWTVLLQTFGAEVELLTDLDKDSRVLYGTQVPQHHGPTGLQVQAAMARLTQRMSQARAAHLATVFYFVYAGHGDIDGGEGYLALTDQRFFRHDLEEQVLAVSRADTNHVIIDACRSFYVAYDRGPGGSRRAWRQPYFVGGAAARFPNTGFLLANSSGGAAHEWEEFQGGIFSHEVRSGLLGGADANGDGNISYSEITAFVRVANQSVRNERYRPDILSRPPQTGESVLVAIANARNGHLRLGRNQIGRHVLEDAIGVRWVDIHPGPTLEVNLVLPETGWGGNELYLRSLSTDVEYKVPRQRDTVLAQLPAQTRSVLRRGALNDAFAQLFAAPFDLAVMTEMPVDDLSAPSGEDPSVRHRRYRQIGALSTGALGVASLALGGYHLLSATRLSSQNQGAEGIARPDINSRIDDHNHWARIGFIGGTALLATAVGLLVWNYRSRSSEDDP